MNTLLLVFAIIALSAYLSLLIDNGYAPGGINIFDKIVENYVAPMLERISHRTYA